MGLRPEYYGAPRSPPQFLLVICLPAPRMETGTVCIGIESSCHGCHYSSQSRFGHSPGSQPEEDMKSTALCGSSSARLGTFLLPASELLFFQNHLTEPSSSCRSASLGDWCRRLCCLHFSRCIPARLTVQEVVHNLRIVNHWL